MVQQSKLREDDEEISLVDILSFLRGAYKSIVIGSIVGLSISLIYFSAIPKRYEAVAQISMAQIGAANIDNNNFNPLGINIEEPSLLIARLLQPTSFTAQALSACRIDDGANLAATLSKSINLSIPKGVANIVELKTFAQSPEIAFACAQAVFELIKTTQAQIIAPYIEEAKLKLDDDNERLAKAKDLVAKADKVGSAMGAAYLSTRDEIRFLLDEITALKNVVTSDQSRATRLIAPIYASNSPVGPKMHSTLTAGFFGGLFFGLLLALTRQLWSKLKADGQ